MAKRYTVSYKVGEEGKPARQLMTYVNYGLRERLLAEAGATRTIASVIRSAIDTAIDEDPYVLGSAFEEFALTPAEFGRLSAGPGSAKRNPFIFPLGVKLPETSFQAVGNTCETLGTRSSQFIRFCLTNSLKD